MLGKVEGKRRRGPQRINSVDMSLSKYQEIVKIAKPGVLYSPWGCEESDMTERLNNNNSLLTWNLKH